MTCQVGFPQDIPIFNGIAHVISEAAMRPDIEAHCTSLAFWPCSHQFCMECPKLTPFFLSFLDSDGRITSRKPFTFSSPPSVRPDWVSPRESIRLWCIYSTKTFRKMLGRQTRDCSNTPPDECRCVVGGTVTSPLAGPELDGRST